MSRLLLAVALTVGLALAACSDPDDTDASDPGAGSEALEFRPVLRPGLACDEVDDGPDGATAVLPDEPTDGSTCTEVGPIGFDGTDLARAEVEQGGPTGREWVVEVEVREDDRATANELINACADVAPTCPTKQMAIVLDSVVISAPAVNEPDLADQPFVISGGGPTGFTEAEAEDLAERIEG